MIPRLIQLFLIVCGTLCVVLGLVGMFVPILPTTPFLLLAAFCYARSSQRFYHWLLTNRWFGEYIRNYREGKGMPPKQKLITIALLWLTIGTAVLFLIPSTWVKLVLLAIGAGVTIHLVSIPIYRPEQDPASRFNATVSSEEFD